jgi:hypothetical protein
MQSHSAIDLLSVYLQTGAAAIIAIGAATALDIDFGRALLAAAIAALLPVLAHLVSPKGE